MKLRILDNSLRFRLSRPEVDQLIAGHPVTACVRFPASGVLRYSLEPGAAQQAMAAEFDGGELRIAVPLAQAKLLSSAEAITLSSEIGGDATLSIKIEKDFQCLVPRDEDESALFDHPRAKSTTC